MMFLFTSNNLIGSRAIRWALEEPCSHFAIVFDSDPAGFGIVFHSKFSGVQFDWWNNFRQHNQIFRAYEPKDSTLYEEEKIYQSIVGKFYGHDYDKCAFFTFGYYGIRRKLTGLPIPRCPSLSSNRDYLCTEIAQGIQEFCPKYLPSALPLGLISPYELLKNMRDSPAIQETSASRIFIPT